MHGNRNLEYILTALISVEENSSASMQTFATTIRVVMSVGGVLLHLLLLTT
jgi:hypothetical protein